MHSRISVSLSEQCSLALARSAADTCYVNSGERAREIPGQRSRGNRLADLTVHYVSTATLCSMCKIAQ